MHGWIDGGKYIHHKPLTHDTRTQQQQQQQQQGEERERESETERTGYLAGKEEEGDNGRQTDRQTDRQT